MLTLYTPQPGKGCLAAIEATLIIVPVWRERIPGNIPIRH
ncbi:hypothetical protein NSP_3050 [Nodularia spumigena CCY9414]|nr:hypothetical protein NSP_3050 [Nodularia spumigena CCY9414]